MGKSKRYWYKDGVQIVWLFMLALESCRAKERHICQAKDFHYAFTECDKHGGRWRVSVPKPGSCFDGSPNPPTRVNTCKISCEAGTYFNLTSLNCLPCHPGTYSLGGGVKFDSWNELPEGFHITVESIENGDWLLYGNNDGKPINCSRYSWRPVGHYIASNGGPCAATLSYSLKLVKPGAVSYTYQYTDDSVIFNFEAQNDQCQTIEEAKGFTWPQTTEEGEWKTVTVPLRAGLNVLYWKTVGLTFTDTVGRKPKPVKMKSLYISGVAYTSECTVCEPGTYSGKGSKHCTFCDENTYSTGGASFCAPCDKETYSTKGSSRCIVRPPCTQRDYYEVHTPCDERNETVVYYKWLEPKTCREDVAGAVRMPTLGKKKPCPPCNPGMEYSEQLKCTFCPKNYYSNGVSRCQKCPSSTTPSYGLFYKWWHELPPGISSRCISVDEVLGCSSSHVWQPAVDHIRTAAGHADNAFLVLSLEVPGFRGRERAINGQAVAIGSVIFTFELICSGDCYFTFVVASSRNSLVEVQNWKGRQRKQQFSFEISQNDSYIFSWAFQKVSNEVEDLLLSSQSHRTDVANIYEIIVTNTIAGGAIECQPCHQSPGAEGCLPCPPGHYLDNKGSLHCLSCPPNFYIPESGLYGPDSCKPCGPGLKSTDGQTCFSDCKFHLTGEKLFDLTELPMFIEVQGSWLFTASGTQYFHLFNISLCGDQGKPSAICKNNVTHNSADQEPQEVRAMVCRSTVMPTQRGNAGLSLTTQAVSLGDTLIAITTEPKIGNISVLDEFLHSAEEDSDIYFFYASYFATPACRTGRSTTVTVRCDKSAKGIGQATPPVSCPDGTCDGCHFHFIWRSQLACRLCSQKDYEVVKGECLHGKQTLHYISSKACRSPRGNETTNHSQKCSAVPLEIEIIIGLSVALGLLLSTLVLYFWKKHRKLEYKYMKLVESNSTKESGHPEAESCAINDDEDDQNDAVAFNEKRSNLLVKFRTLCTNNKEGLGKHYEPIHFTKETIS